MANGRNRRNNRNNNDQNEINEIIQKINKYDKLSDISAKELFDEETGLAYKVANLSRGLKTNQIRRFFGAIRKMENKSSWKEIEPEFYLLKPRMAVGVGRKLVPKDFYKVIMAAMNKVNIGSEEEKLENFKVFVEFFESIVAYHKFLGGD